VSPPTPEELAAQRWFGGKTGTIKLETAGTFTYYCTIHHGMNGTVVVS